jgi:hypothetical protein
MALCFLKAKLAPTEKLAPTKKLAPTVEAQNWHWNLGLMDRGIFYRPIRSVKAAIQKRS